MIRLKIVVSVIFLASTLLLFSFIEIKIAYVLQAQVNSITVTKHFQILKSFYSILLLYYTIRLLFYHI